jgi:membrane protease YdiL (CAAX protease family)
MKPTSAFRPINLLYFSVLCLMVANTWLVWMPQYVRLVLNEILFVFLPGYLYLRWSRQPIAERVRWRWPGWRIALLSLAVGAGLYPLSAVSAGVLVSVLGYVNVPTPADAIPNTALMGGLAVLAFGILAPLCEEFLFRGILQPVYETRGAKWGVLFVGFLFVAFHLSLLQGLSIILLALALGVVNYRTRSLPASILTHFGANGLAALMVTQQVFPTGIQNWITLLPFLVGGVVLSGLAMFCLLGMTSGEQSRRRPTASDEMDGSIPAVRPRASTRLSVAWPLFAALALYLTVIGMEWVYSHTPEQAAEVKISGPALQVGASPWSTPQTWRYEIRNVADTVVGEGECNLTPMVQEMELICSSTVQAYEVKQGQSTFASSGGQRIDTLRWNKTDSKFISGASSLDLQGGFTSQVDFRLGEEQIEVAYQEQGKPEKRLDLPFQKTAFSQNPALPLAPDYTWPWQLAGLSQSEREPGSVMRFNPYTWNNTTRSSGPLAEPQQIKVSGPSRVETPAGSFQAWSTAKGDRDQVWYANIDGTLTVVKYFNGIETWVIE